MFISRCPYKETWSSFFPHFLICLYNILLLIVLFFLGNPLCHTTEILLTERIVSPVWQILTIQQVGVLILILYSTKGQTLDMRGACSARTATALPPDFFKPLCARVRQWGFCFTVQQHTLKSLKTSQLILPEPHPYMTKWAQVPCATQATFQKCRIQLVRGLWKAGSNRSGTQMAKMSSYSYWSTFRDGGFVFFFLSVQHSYISES